MLSVNKPSDTDPSDALTTDVEQLWRLVFELVLDAEKQVAAQLAGHGLTTPQFYVLKTLTEQGGRCPIGEIARLHGLTNATMTGLIKRMEQFTPPLVERVKNDADHRSVYVVLTESGTARYLAVQQELMMQLRAMFALLDADLRATILRDVSLYAGLLRGALANLGAG